MSNDLTAQGDRLLEILTAAVNRGHGQDLYSALTTEPTTVEDYDDLPISPAYDDTQGLGARSPQPRDDLEHHLRQALGL